MRGSLSVRVSDGYTSRLVTSRTTDLKFRKTAPGGHHSASCTISVPRNTFRDLGPADKLYIYDSRTAATVWEGYTENPGATDGPAGQSYDLSAVGGMVLASDRAERLPYIDQSLASWRKDDIHPQAASGTADASQFPGNAGTRAGGAALFVQFNPGQPIALNYQTGLVYDAFKGSPVTFGGIAGWRDAGLTDATYLQQLTADPYLTGEPNVNVTMNATGSAMSGFAGTDFIAGKTAITFRLVRNPGGATNVATDDVWGALGELFVFGHLVDRFGALRTMNAAITNLALPFPSTATSAGLLASDIAEDLLGRVLTMCDPGSARIEASSVPIDQLSYLEAVKAADVFDDLMLHEPDFLWEILETTAAGKHQFNYRAWPTTPRYEISTKDGYNAPGGDVDLCNRITVNWTDAKGNQQTTVVPSTVPELGSRVRDAGSVSLPEGRGSAANAQRVGEQILAAKNHPPRAATAFVRRPIFDNVRGCMVMPWEIEPGYVVRVRETGEDLRMTEMEYTDADCAATLTLGTPTLSEEQILARVAA